MKDCVSYFCDHWLLTNNNWYEGIALGTSSTNNGIESTNGVIKRENALRERLPVGQFLNTASNILKKWFTDRQPECTNYKPFHENPSVSLRQWTDAWRWAMESRKVMKGKSDKYYTCSLREKNPINSALLTEYKNKQGKWKSFSEFVRLEYGV